MELYIDITDARAVVTLNRPEKSNAVSRAMLDELDTFFRQLEQFSEVRAVILTGAGTEVFCAGADMEEVTGVNDRHAWLHAHRGQNLCEFIERAPMPVIAAINGAAVAGGCEILLATHLRVMSETAYLSMPQAYLGMMPGYGGSQRLARAVGNPRALEMLLTGRRISAQEAFDWGIVNRVVAPEEVMPTARALAEEVARMAPLAIRSCLRAVLDGSDRPMVEAMSIEAELFCRLFLTADLREGTRAFLEKRQPVFQGK